MAYSLGSTQPASTSANYLSSLSPQQLGILGACAVGILALVILGNQGSGRKSRLATSRWAKGGDRSRAKKRAKQQINGREKNKVTLWVNGPKINVVHHEKNPTQYNVSGDHKTIYIPDAQR
ncbi:MAG: type IV secretory system conjugative DNA transfer family protein, partial [Cyanobacteria bacterium J06633_23]